MIWLSVSKVKLRQRITRSTRFAPLTKMLGFASHFAYTENDRLNGSGCDIEPLSSVQIITKYIDDTT